VGVDDAGTDPEEGLQFEWDARKSERNRAMGRPSFEEATTVYLDPLAVTVPDRHHSEMEERDVTVGMSAQGRLLVVASTEREGRLRLISVRLASPKERRDYEG
jgi:uncharacterized protein